MTQEQREHANMISNMFSELMHKKYRKGAEEHGGNLWEMGSDQLLDNAIDEAIDQVVYLLTLKETLKEDLEYAWRYRDMRES